MSKAKISFCTSCMGRTYHLEKTYVRNILSNLDYDNVEFVLLNWNSPDDLDDFVAAELKRYIDMGVVRYLKVTSHEYFHMARAKNISATAATGDIVCWVDADNYTGAGFAEYLNSVFQSSPNALVVPPRRADWTQRAYEQFVDLYTDAAQVHMRQGAMGRIAVRREHFIGVGGYDESLEGWGYEDTDFSIRCERLFGLARMFPDPRYLECIPHDASVRLEHCRLPEGTGSELEKLQEMERRNNEISASNMATRTLIANRGNPWVPQV